MKELRYSEKTQKQQTLSDAKGVGPETDKLKDKFKEGSIPLQTDFNQLIDIADIGRRATGQAPDQNGPAKGMHLDKNGLLQLKLNENYYNNGNYSPLKLHDDVLVVGVGPGLTTYTRAHEIGIKGKVGLNVSDDGVSVKAANGIVVDDNGVSVKAGNGITVNADGVQLKLNEKYDDRYNTPLKLHKDVLVVGVNAGLITYHTEDKESHYIGINPGYGLKIDGDSVAIDTETVLPRGMIMMFSGGNIPTGWALCNGENGTPDLRGRFIKASSDGVKSSSGGSNKINFTPQGSVSVKLHELTLDQIPAHNHKTSVKIDSSIWGGVAGNDGEKYQGVGIIDHWNEFPIDNSGGGKGHYHDASFAGKLSEVTFEPPYYSLAFIMKL
ncbi:tail collar domain [Xenorhabdus cabanillasii]|uniref:Tail collar domain n=1 Tax=Xenorhabdus cabanillasii TaxID=351673 RepID=A0A3D9UIR8_9GAMM|nr:tail fiber protein [Xenorhabdus cabanillasii]REF25894.1 tail collar domain [Xenorhabdus cabanillasii]